MRPSEKPKLFHCCRFDPEHRAWGIYSRAKKEMPTTSFLLETITFDFEVAKEHAKQWTEQNPEHDYAVQGAPTSSHLPARCNP